MQGTYVLLESDEIDPDDKEIFLHLKQEMESE